MRERRFLVDPADVTGDRAVVRGGELRHLSRVLRLRAGDEVSVFDGRGAGYRGILEIVEGSRAVVVLREPEDAGVEPTLRVSLLQAIPHGERMDLIVEKATELGAARIIPVTSEHSVVRPRAGGGARLERWRRIAVAAAKQSGRLVVPEVAGPIPFDDAVGWRAAGAVTPVREGAEAPRIIFHPRGGNLASTFWTEGAPHPAETAILVGPEGGWSGAEIDRATASGWVAAGLGARVLRADTAAAVALALVLSRAGEMSR